MKRDRLNRSVVYATVLLLISVLTYARLGTVGAFAQTDPPTEPVTEPVETDLATEPVTEPVETDPPTEPVTEPVETDPATEPATEPIETEPTTDPVTEPVETDPPTEPATEPVETDPPTEPSTEPVETDPTIDEDFEQKNGARIRFIILLVVVAAISAIIAIVTIILLCRKGISKRELQQGKAVNLPHAQGVELPWGMKDTRSIDLVARVSVEEVDQLMSDARAAELLEETRERGGRGKMGIVNIGLICPAFEAGDVITLQALKEKNLIAPDAGRVKVLASGSIDRPLTVKADAFSVQAIKMITVTGGHAVRLMGGDR